ncbi:MAG: NADH-quinone oxidoreductase subunit A [Bdellovibrionales bacterium]|nr:NADH-quinone oxidoreductase subunit A [Bdellovibrionales bacterium]MBL7669916.1 NADH-quinone oxidoreductase subunit A [Pseudobdellovibrionaceae bacterium]
MPIGGVIFLTIFIAVFGTALIYLARLTGGMRKNNSAVKKEVYECGIPGQEKKDTKISVKFYLTAILFILFDIEIIFMYPWAITFKEFISKGQGAFVFVSMMIFIAIFIFGLFWEIKSKALEWD